jgi:hypothetical protein
MLCPMQWLLFLNLVSDLDLPIASKPIVNQTVILTLSLLRMRQLRQGVPEALRIPFLDAIMKDGEYVYVENPHVLISYRINILSSGFWPLSFEYCSRPRDGTTITLRIFSVGSFR